MELLRILLGRSDHSLPAVVLAMTEDIAGTAP